VQALIGTFLAPILAWVETLVLRRMLRHCVEHPLVLLNQWYDPAPLVAACAAYRHPDGTPGAPPTFSLDQLVRAEIVRAWADSCSDPELEFQLATNLLLRWFVGLPLVGRTPDHATLNRFHAYLSDQAPELWFQDSLRFLDRVDPEPPASTPQIVDTFAMESPVAPSTSTAHLLAHLTVRLSRLWQAHAPRASQHALAALDLSCLVRLPIARTPVARQQRLQTVLTLVAAVVSTLTPQLDALDATLRSTVQRYLDALAKVQADELTTNEAGLVVERTTKTHGARRLGSAVDLDATFRKHEGSPAVLGTNAVISTTRTRIRAGVALTGCSPDNEAPIVALQQQRDAGLPLPPHIVMDQAGGWGKCRARTDAVSEGQTVMVAHTPSGGGSDPNRFSVANFQVDAERKSCTCPAGVVSTRVYASGDGDGVYFRYLASQCRGCAEWDSCRDPKAKPNGHRSVFISDYHVYLRMGLAFNATPSGKALLGGRWQVEPTVAWLVRYQGCRRARRVGQAAAQFQLYQACAMRNLLLWVARVQRKEAPRPT
jgi:hypothetical protein